jgi:hypothetical protein
MVFPEVAFRIAERRTDLDAFEEELVRQLAGVRAERDELAVAEKVLARFDRQARPEPPVSTPVSAQVAGRAVLLVPHRAAGMEDTALPADYQRILGLVRAVGGLVATRRVGEGLGMDAEVRGKLEPLRGKLSKLADRGWLRKLPDGRFTVLL